MRKPLVALLLPLILILAACSAAEAQDVSPTPTRSISGTQTPEATIQPTPQAADNKKSDEDHRKRVEELAEHQFDEFARSNAANEEFWGLRDFELFGNDKSKDPEIKKTADAPLIYTATFKDIWIKGNDAGGDKIKRERTLVMTYILDSAGEWELSSTEFSRDEPLSFWKQVWLGFLGVGAGGVLLTFFLSNLLTDSNNNWNNFGITIITLLDVVVGVVGAIWMGTEFFDSLLAGILLLIPCILIPLASTWLTVIVFAVGWSLITWILTFLSILGGGLILYLILLKQDWTYEISLVGVGVLFIGFFCNYQANKNSGTKEGSAWALNGLFALLWAVVMVITGIVRVAI